MFRGMTFEVRYKIGYLFEDYLQQISMYDSWDTLTNPT